MADTIYDKAIKYGFRYGGNQTLHVEATNADYVNRRGSAFVLFRNGVARLCASNSASVDGWLEVPKETTHDQAVRLDSNDYSVIIDRSAVFEAPVNESLASLCASHIGKSAYFVESGSGTSKKQEVKLQSASVKCGSPLVLIRDVDTTNKSVFVSMNPNKVS